MKKVFTKIYLILNNLWFVAILLIFVLDLLFYYAEYFNSELNAKLNSYQQMYEAVTTCTLLLILAMSLIFMFMIYKKAISTLTSSEEKRIYSHFPERIAPSVLLVLILFLVGESLKLLKGEPPQKKVFCQKTQIDPSVNKYKPALDYFFQKTSEQKRYYGIERILPCLVIKETEPVQYTSKIGDFIYAFFDKQNAHENYLPVVVQGEIDLTDPQIAAATLSHGLFPAFSYMLEQESPQEKRASCLQSIVNAYDDSSLFLLGTDLFLDKEEGGLRVDMPKFTDNQKKQYAFLAFQFDNFYLKPFSKCTDMNVDKDYPKFQECMLEEKLKNIEDYVYNDLYYREQCAYE